MTMYRMRLREHILMLIEAVIELRSGAVRHCGAAPRDAVRRAHAHAAGAADDHRALPAGGHRAARTRFAAAAGGVRDHQPQSARRLRDYRNRLSDRSRADERPAGVRRPDRQYLRQHRDRRLPARERGGGAACCSSGLGRFVQDLLLWCTVEFGYLRLADGFVQCEQHHAAEAQSGRARARARHCQQGGRPGGRHHHRRPQHAVRRHRRHRRRSAAARGVGVPGCRARGDARRRLAARRRARRRAARGARRGRRHDV